MLLCSIAATTILAAHANAHGPPRELALWGGFTGDAAGCQRVLSRATSLCVGQVVALRGECLSAAVRGDACDDTALAARVSEAHQRALDQVEHACTSAEVQQLGYADLAEARQDVDNACRQLDVAAMSAAFGPVIVGGTVASSEDPAARCVTTATREATRLLRFGMRTYAKALDRIAALDLAADQKQRLIAWAESRIEQTRARSRAALTTVCSDSDFSFTYGRSADTFLASIVDQAACMQQLVYVQDAVRCPTPRCGNGVEEPGEQCDDGNTFDDDGCRADCVEVSCTAFPTIYDLIQQAVFESYGCTAGACHGSAQAGSLDLRAAVSRERLIDVPSIVDPARKRIEPGDAERSVLFLKLAAKTLPEQYPADELGVGAAMPNGPVPGLTEHELEAVRRWINGGAPRTDAVPGVAGPLHGCYPAPRS